jgi:hypothetical protein
MASGFGSAGWSSHHGDAMCRLRKMSDYIYELILRELYEGAGF